MYAPRRRRAVRFDQAAKPLLWLRENEGERGRKTQGDGKVVGQRHKHTVSTWPPTGPDQGLSGERSSLEPLIDGCPRGSGRDGASR